MKMVSAAFNTARVVPDESECQNCKQQAVKRWETNRSAIDCCPDACSLLQVVVGVYYCNYCDLFFRNQPGFLRPNSIYTNKVVNVAIASVVEDGMPITRVDVLEWFAKRDRSEPLKVFRGRPYRKNDQCYVEQKNYTHVRHLFGYGRIDWEPAVAKMNKLYRNGWSELQNLFMPQQKLVEKQRMNAKVRRKMDVPKTPFERLKQFMSKRDQAVMEAKYKRLNPINIKSRLTREVRNLFGYLKEWIDKSEWGKMELRLISPSNSEPA